MPAAFFLTAERPPPFDAAPPFFAALLRVVLLAAANPLLADADFEAPLRPDDFDAPLLLFAAALLRPCAELRLAEDLDPPFEAALDLPPVLFEAALERPPPEDLLAALVLPPDLEAFFAGTLAPFSLASDKPMAIA